MGSIVPVNPDSLQRLTDRLDSIEQQLRTLQRPTGTSVAGLVAQVQAAIATIGATVTTYLSGGFTTGSMHATGNVQVDGNSTTDGDVTAGGKVTAVDVYNRPLTYGGLYKVQYIHQDGTMGYVSSSRRFKQDITTATIPELRAIMRQLRVVTFRYIQAVENLGDGASVEWGVIAEEIHDLGLFWLVEYDEDGMPQGVRKDQFAFLALMDARDKQEQIDELRGRLEAAGL